jgi:hypothetical protein
LLYALNGFAMVAAYIQKVTVLPKCWVTEAVSRAPVFDGEPPAEEPTLDLMVLHEYTSAPRQGLRPPACQ